MLAVSNRVNSMSFRPANHMVGLPTYEQYRHCMEKKAENGQPLTIYGIPTNKLFPNTMQPPPPQPPVLMRSTRKRVRCENTIEYDSDDDYESGDIEM